VSEFRKCPFCSAQVMNDPAAQVIGHEYPPCEGFTSLLQRAADEGLKPARTYVGVRGKGGRELMTLISQLQCDGCGVSVPEAKSEEWIRARLDQYRLAATGSKTYQLDVCPSCAHQYALALLIEKNSKKGVRP
jgi:hypothetical protein